MHVEYCSMKKMRLLFLLSILDLSKTIFAADFDPEQLRQAMETSLAEFEAIQDDDQALEEAIRLSLLNDNHRGMVEKNAFQAQKEHFNQNEINSLCVLQEQKVDVDKKSESDQKAAFSRLSIDQLLENSNFIKVIGEFLMQTKKDHEAPYEIQDIQNDIASYEFMLTYPDGCNVPDVQASLDQAKKLLLEKEMQAGKPDYTQALHKKFVFKDSQQQEYRFTKEEAKTILDTML